MLILTSEMTAFFALICMDPYRSSLGVGGVINETKKKHCVFLGNGFLGDNVFMVIYMKGLRMVKLTHI